MDKWAEALETCWDLPMTHLDTGTCLLTPPALPSSLLSGWSQPTLLSAWHMDAGSLTNDVGVT